MKIALSGKMMSGKTIIADYLVSKYGFVELAFADRLKELALELFGMSPEDKDRELLQLLGMKMRQLDPNVWVRYVMNEIPDNKDVVVSDVRLMNEFDTLRRHGFTMVKCFVGEEKQKERLKIDMPDMCDELRFHRSEIELDIIPLYKWEKGEAHWDVIIHNDGCTMEQLLLQADALIYREKYYGNG